MPLDVLYLKYKYHSLLAIMDIKITDTFYGQLLWRNTSYEATYQTERAKAGMDRSSSAKWWLVNRRQAFLYGAADARPLHLPSE